MGSEWFGFDINNRKIVMCDDGKTKISSSSWGQCAKAVVKVLSLPVSKTNGRDGLCIDDFVGRQVFVQSFLVSQRDMLDSLNKVLKTTDEDWEIGYEASKERYKSGLEELKGGNRFGLAKAMYARVFYPNGDADTSDKLDNEVLGLAEEDIDTNVKLAVDMAEDGFREKVLKELQLH